MQSREQLDPGERILQPLLVSKEVNFGVVFRYNGVASYRQPQPLANVDSRLRRQVNHWSVTNNRLAFFGTALAVNAKGPTMLAQVLYGVPGADFLLQLVLASLLTQSDLVHLF